MLFVLERAAFPDFYVRFVSEDEWEKTKTVPERDMNDEIKAAGLPDELIGRLYPNVPNTYYISMFDMSMDDFVEKAKAYGFFESAAIQDQMFLDMEEEEEEYENKYATELGLDDEKVPLFFFFYDNGDEVTVRFNTQKYFDENDGAMPDQHLGHYLNKYRNIPVDEKLDEVCENMFSLEHTEFEGKKDELIQYLESLGVEYRPEQDFKD
jgi:hypothetical protein